MSSFCAARPSRGWVCACGGIFSGVKFCVASQALHDDGCGSVFSVLLVVAFCSVVAPAAAASHRPWLDRCSNDIMTVVVVACGAASFGQFCSVPAVLRYLALCARVVVPTKKTCPMHSTFFMWSLQSFFAVLIFSFHFLTWKGFLTGRSVCEIYYFKNVNRNTCCTPSELLLCLKLVGLRLEPSVISVVGMNCVTFCEN